jgi:hypothetical protein
MLIAFSLSIKKKILKINSYKQAKLTFFVSKSRFCVVSKSFISFFIKQKIEYYKNDNYCDENNYILNKTWPPREIKLKELFLEK